MRLVRHGSTLRATRGRRPEVIAATGASSEPAAASPSPPPQPRDGGERCNQCRWDAAVRSNGGLFRLAVVPLQLAFLTGEWHGLRFLASREPRQERDGDSRDKDG